MDLVLAVVNQSLAEQKKQEDRALEKALTLSRQQQRQQPQQGGANGSSSSAPGSATAASPLGETEASILQSTLQASERDAKISQLVAMMPPAGGVNPEYIRTQAQFFLESANWDVEVAVANMFANF